MPEIPQGFAGARYKGLGAGLQEGVKHRNADGTLKKGVSLEPGDEMLWRDEDVYGKTLWHDPNQNLRSKYIGLGKVVTPEHAGKSEQELIEIGFEFHSPRSDLEPLEPLEAFLARQSKPAEEEIPLTFTIEQPPEEQDPLEAMEQESEQS
jgi:hypothetical protein